MESWSAEVYQEGITLARTSEITENLCDMLGGESLARLYLDDKALLHEKVGHIVTEGSSVLVQHVEDFLLSDAQSALAEAMGKPVLVYPFQVPV